MPHSTNLTETLKAIEDSTKGDEISFADVIRALNHRGFGALMIGPALITALPTGAIPGIPAICGLFIAIVSLQIAFGKSFPWLPQRLKEMAFERKKYQDAINKAEPYMEKIDSFFHPRFKFLVSPFMQRIVACFCFILSMAMIFLGFIPFLPMLPAVTILFFGLSFSVHDGLLMAIGLFLFAVSLAVVPWLIMNFMS
jgi:hypothetical protein